MKIYEALHNPSCCESAAYTISIHKTKLGAYRAIKASKLDAWEEWLEHHRYSKKHEMKSRLEYKNYTIHSDEYKFDFDKWWGISETILND